MANASSIEGDALFRKTLVTVGTMLAVLVAFVGTLSLLVAFIVQRAVGGGSAQEATPAAVAPLPSPAKAVPNHVTASARHTEAI
jgi:hypothetical protein